MSTTPASKRPPGRSTVRDQSEGASLPRGRRKATTLSPIEVPASGTAAGGNDDVLLAVPHIGHRVGDAGHRQPALPQLGAGLGREGAQIGIERAGEDEAAARDQDAAEERRAPRKSEAERCLVLVVPTVDCHRTLPAFRSTATIAPQGGGLHKLPSARTAPPRASSRSERRAAPRIPLRARA